MRAVASTQPQLGFVHVGKPLLCCIFDVAGNSFQQLVSFQGTTALLPTWHPRLGAALRNIRKRAAVNVNCFELGTTSRRTITSLEPLVGHNVGLYLGTLTISYRAQRVCTGSCVKVFAGECTEGHLPEWPSAFVGDAVI